MTRYPTSRIRKIAWTWIFRTRKGMKSKWRIVLVDVQVLLHTWRPRTAGIVWARNDSVFAGLWTGLWTMSLALLGIDSQFSTCALQFLVFCHGSFAFSQLGLEARCGLTTCTVLHGHDIPMLKACDISIILKINIG